MEGWRVRGVGMMGVGQRTSCLEKSRNAILSLSLPLSPSLSLTLQLVFPPSLPLVRWTDDRRESERKRENRERHRETWRERERERERYNS